VVHVSQFGSCKTGSTAVGYTVGRRTIPCISNCWARPLGLQKLVYFNWGSTCRKVLEPLIYSIVQKFLYVFNLCAITNLCVLQSLQTTNEKKQKNAARQIISIRV